MVVAATIEPYMRCTALLVRPSQEDVPEVRAGTPMSPDGAEEHPFCQVPYEVGYHSAMEIRFAAGSFLDHGPASAWLRMRMPLVDAEEPSPLTRVLIAADAGNGVGNVLDFRQYLFVNADLTVHLVRYPVGEWVRLDATTSVDRAGVGLADTSLHDQRGQIGRGAQSLVVRRR
jgi:hypothetical protein